MPDYFSHPTAEVSDKATIGEGTKVWHYAQIRENVTIGKNCIIGKNVYIDSGVTIGSNVKIQNNACLYKGLTVEDGVFIGPMVCITNDKFPRAINSDGSLKTDNDWEVTPTVIKKGASIGAQAVLVGGIKIGEWAMIGAGSVVTKNVPAYGLAYGNPATIQGKVAKE